MLKHKYYLTYKLPAKWCAEEDNDNLIIYNPNGDGAMTISFFSILEVEKTLNEQMRIMAKKFIDQNKIVLHAPLILHSSKNAKTILYGTGTTPDNCFIKLWVVAKYPKVAFVTYESETKSKEVNKCDDIIKSMKFTF